MSQTAINIGWNTPTGQALVGGVLSLLMCVVVYFGGLPAALLFLVLVFLPPRAMLLAFVCLSYFRIHEAYPFLLPLKLPLVFSAGSIAAIIIFAINISRQADAPKANWLIGALIMTFLAADVIVLGDLAGDSANNRPVLAVAMLLSAIAFYTWYRALAAMTAPRWGREMGLFVAFFVCTTLGIAFAQNPGVAFTQWNNVYWKIGAMTLVLAWFLRTEKDYRLALWMLIGSGCLVAVVTWFNWYYGIDLVEGSRVTIGRTLFSTPDDIANAVPGMPVQGGSQLGDPNDLALVLLFPIGMAVAVLVKMGPRTPLGFLSLIAVPLLISAILLTQSRGGALGVMAVFGTLGLFYIRSKIILGTLIAVGALGLFVAMDIESRKSGGLTELEGGLDRSSLERIHAWTAALSMTASHPMSGVGLSNFSGQFRRHTPVWSGREMAAHSTWFQIMAETGIPGIAFFLATISAVALAMRRAWQILLQRTQSPVLLTFSLGLFPAFVSFCVAGTFLSQGFRWPIYLLIGFTAALSCTARSMQHDAAAAAPEPTTSNIGATV